MGIKSHLARCAKITNTLLGDLGTLHRHGGETVTGVSVIIDQSAEVQAEFGVVAGYDIEIILLKSEVGSVGRLDSVELDGETYRINIITRETSAKFYCSVVKLG